jgi:hypothetical protein
VGCPINIQVRCDESFPCGSGEACVAGACVRVEAPGVGGACASSAECGAGRTCGTGFPGGYCLAPCGSGGACPSGSVCVNELGWCMRACGQACSRPGYACLPVPQPGSATRACAPTSGHTGDGGPLDPDPPGDGGCAGSVPLDGPCGRTCDCSTPGAECVENLCVQTCSRDTDCPEDRRCNEDSHQCEVGPRLGDPCDNSFECPGVARCNPERHRCEESCSTDWGCPAGYRCSPDQLCVEECTGAPPATVGLTCESSMDCASCGFCVASGEQRRCRQPCHLDRDCPGGALGACEQVGSQVRVCRLP